MNMVTHKVRLRGPEHFGGRLPPRHLGQFFAELPVAIRASVSMAFRNRSHVRGPCPGWLERASDIRFVDHQGNGESVLYFEAPRLGDAAADLYAQKSLFPDDRPSSDDTAFDLFGDVLADIERREADSTRYDDALLNDLRRFDRVFKRGPYHEIEFSSRCLSLNTRARLTPAIVQSAQLLRGETPAPQRVRLVGNLDGLVASTQRFSLLLDSGETVVGCFPEEQFEEVQGLWRKRVLVLGTAVYRASGRLLRIDAERVKPGDRESAVFSRMPSTPGHKVDVSRLRKPQGPRSGMAAIIGKWPGDESDEEIEAALERLS